MESLSITSAQVEYNFDAVEEQLKNYLKDYQGLVFTEEKKNEAKKTLAQIRKDKQEFLNLLKSAKKTYMEPWKNFYERAMKLAAMYDEPIVFIDEQIEAFEEERKKEKAERIKSIYAEIVPEEEIRFYIPLVKLYIPKWQNATYTEKQIKDDIMQAKMNVKQSLESIKALHSDVEDRALEVFKFSLSFPDALKVITDYEANKRVVLAKETVKLSEEALNEAKKEAVESFIPAPTLEDPVAHNYTIFLTSDAKEKIEAFMDSVGLDYFERG